MRRSTWALVLGLVGVGVMSIGAEPARQTTASGKPLALVGGTLIDGFGGPPLRNSVILVRGERIAAVGQVGSLAVPSDAEVVSTEGMSVLPGLWDMHVHTMIDGHSDYAHWDKTYPPRLEKDDDAGVGAPAAHGGGDDRARPGRAARGQHPRTRRDQPRRHSRRDAVRLRPVHPARAVSRAPTTSAGASTASPTRARKCRSWRTPAWT